MKSAAFLDKIAHRRWRGIAAALAVFAVLLLAGKAAERALLRGEARALEVHGALAAASLKDRLMTIERAMDEATQFFAASGERSRADWRVYVQEQQLATRIPALRGLHFGLWLPAARLEQHVAAVRAEGFPQYAIRPPGARADYVPLVWPEPMDERNRRVLGFDLYSEPVRRAAMDLARDSGRIALSGRVLLAGETTDPQPGFVMFAPVYRADAPPARVEARRAALYGFVAGPVRMPDLTQGLFGGPLAGLEVEIYDGETPSEKSWLHAPDGRLRATAPADPATPSFSRTLHSGGRTWTIYVQARNPSGIRSHRGLYWLMVAAGAAAAAFGAWRLLGKRGRVGPHAG